MASQYKNTDTKKFSEWNIPYRSETVIKLKTTVPEPESLQIPLIDTTSNQCKFIAGEDDKCCGHPIHDGAYCKHHHERCVVMKEPMREWMWSIWKR